MTTTTLHIAQMDCPTEESLIKGHLKNIPGILELEFNIMQKELRIIHQDLEVATIQQALLAIGMRSEIKDSSYTAKSLSLLEPKVNYRDWIILGISGTLAILAEVSSYIYGIENSYSVIILAILSMLIGGQQTLIKGLRTIRTFTFNMNFLMTIAIIGAAIIGEWPEAAMVTFLFSLAEMIESYSLDKARHAISKLIEITPDMATVKTGGGTWKVKPVKEVEINDIILVKPGDKIPMDGVVISGRSSVNQASITGESLPVEKVNGDMVFAGSINERGTLEFKVSTHLNDTLIAKIIRTVQQAQSERAPAQRFVDQFAKYYTPSVVLFAIAIATLPPIVTGAVFDVWFYKALVLLVIACPCALVISTPVTIVSGLAAAAKNGILIKGGTYLEMGHKLKAIAFDKTGTLTHGEPQITDIVMTSGLSESAALDISASLESHSEHPLAEAILQKWKKLNPQNNLPYLNDFESIPGRGVIGNIDGQKYFLGNHRFAESNGVCNIQIEKILEELEQQGKTTIILFDEEEVLAILAATDTLRSSSIESIKSLHNLNIKTAMITGDNPTTAQKIANIIGIDDVQANLLPEDKLSAIDVLLKKYGVVGMVGDGINDAPALAKASIGFAMGTIGTDVALETADIALMEDNLNKLPFFISLSRRTWYKLVENISLSIGVKAIFFTLALMGSATLWMAILADMGASLIVVLNGLNLLRFSDVRKNY